jgi:hypothetical protein
MTKHPCKPISSPAIGTTITSFSLSITNFFFLLHQSNPTTNIFSLCREPLALSPSSRQSSDDSHNLYARWVSTSPSPMFFLFFYT